MHLNHDILQTIGYRKLILTCIPQTFFGTLKFDLRLSCRPQYVKKSLSLWSFPLDWSYGYFGASVFNTKQNFVNNFVNKFNEKQHIQ